MVSGGAALRPLACTVRAGGYGRRVPLTMEQRHAIARLVAHPAAASKTPTEAFVDAVRSYLAAMGDIIERRSPHLWPTAEPLLAETCGPYYSWGEITEAWWAAFKDDVDWDWEGQPTGLAAAHAIDAIDGLLAAPFKIVFGWPSFGTTVAAMDVALDSDGRRDELARVLLEPLGFTGVEVDVAVRVADQVSSLDEWRSVVERLTRRR